MISYIFYFATEPFFESYTEWIKFYLSEMGIEIKEVIFNTLSTPFLAIYHLPTLKKGILFWQEQSHGGSVAKLNL